MPIASLSRIILGLWLITTGLLLIVPGVAVPPVIMGLWAVIAGVMVLLEGRPPA